MKLVVDQASQKIVGAHMLGEDAAEIIQGVAIAVVMGATKADFDRTIGIHPTAAEEFVTLRTRDRRGGGEGGGMTGSSGPGPTWWRRPCALFGARASGGSAKRAAQ